MDKLNRCFCFLTEDDDNNIWDKVSADSKPVNNKEFLKTKIKSHGDEVTDLMIKNCLR